MKNLVKLHAEKKAYDYNGNNITFRNEEGILYVNATEMAKPFGKKPANFLKLPSTIEFIEKLIEVTKNNNVDYQLIITEKGGYGGGGTTWFQEDLALDFSQWLSPDLRFWCNSKIKELLLTGKTEIKRLSGVEYAQRLLEMEIEHEGMVKVIETQKEQLQIAAPKVKYHDEVLNSSSLFTVTQIANDFGYSARKFNDILHVLEIIYKDGGKTWVLATKYRSEGFAQMTTEIVRNRAGVVLYTYKLLKWTDKGIKFLKEVVAAKESLFKQAKI